MAELPAFPKPSQPEGHVHLTKKQKRIVTLELSEDRMEQIALRSIFVDLCQGGLLKGVN